MTNTAASTPKHRNLTGKKRVLHKVTVNFVPRSWAAIKEAAALTGHTQTETINRAAMLYKEAVAARENGGGVYIRDHEDTKLERVTLL